MNTTPQKKVTMTQSHSSGLVTPLNIKIQSNPGCPPYLLPPKRHASSRLSLEASSVFRFTFLEAEKLKEWHEVNQLYSDDSCRTTH